MFMDFMDNVTCRRKVIKDKGGCVIRATVG